MILLVEDNLVERNLYLAALTAAGFEVQTASDGAEALMALAARVPDCVVTDWRMPRVDGRELALAIRSTRAWADVPIILVSALNERDLLPQTAGLRIGYYFTKPVDLELLVFEARQLIGRR